MNKHRITLSVSLLLLAAGVSAQESKGLRNADGMTLGSAGDAAVEKVFIVQLRSPSAAEHHAAIKAPVAAKLSPGDARPDRLQKNSPAMQAYTATLESEQRVVLDKVKRGTTPIYSYKYGLNGFAARMSVGQAEKLKNLPEVLNVWEDEERPLATEFSAEFLDLFNNEKGLRTIEGLDGDGIVIAFIDSGIAPDHPQLQDTREADRPRACRSSWGETTLLGRWLCKRYRRLDDVLVFEPPEDWNGECETGEEFTADVCNNKLIGARWFIDGAQNTGPIDDKEFRSPRDADGHGTHTATTAVGNYRQASIFGSAIGGVEGMAPKARAAVYKACWIRPGRTRASCNTSDLANAIDAAVADGVDIINYSVGSTMREVVAPDDIALMAATKAGVLAVVAGGNEGPNLATIGSPAGGPWVITAAASTRTGDSAVEAMQIESPTSIQGRIATREALFSPLLSERGPIEGRLVLVDDGDETLDNGNPGITSDGCQPLVNGSEVSGNIALLQRSGCLFTDMIKNAEDAGATAAIVYNIAGDPIVMFGEDNIVDIPAVMIAQADANLILAELDADVEVTVTLEKSLLLTTDEQGNEMAVFSARGPGPVPDILKPDVTAPGVNIIAGFTADPANATPGEDYAYLSGTSMSTPHVAGVAALLRQAHPDWSPAAIKSALMTSARQDVQVPDRTVTPFDYGSGHIVPNDALNPGIVYDISDDEYDAFACSVASPAVSDERCTELAGSGFELRAKALNQPSISLSRLANTDTVTRTVTNPGDETITLNASITPPPGISIEVVPNSISLSPGASASYDVTASYQSGPMDLWRFGSLTWSNTDVAARSPIAIKPTSISAPLELTGSGGTGAGSFPVEFGYNGSYVPRVHGLNAQSIRAGFVDRDPDKTFTRRNLNGVTEHVFAVESDQVLLRFALFDELTDGNDDLDMYVYYCGIDGTACSRIGESGEPTSNEKFDLYNPAPGFYGVYVHGFETDQVAGGPGANYSLLAWSLGDLEDNGNLTASGPAFVNAGTVADVSINWADLVSNNYYLGAISHNTPDGIAALTIVFIRN